MRREIPAAFILLLIYCSAAVAAAAYRRDCVCNTDECWKIARKASEEAQGIPAIRQELEKLQADIERMERYSRGPIPDEDRISIQREIEEKRAQLVQQKQNLDQAQRRAQDSWNQWRQSAHNGIIMNNSFGEWSVVGTRVQPVQNASDLCQSPELGDNKKAYADLFKEPGKDPDKPQHASRPGFGPPPPLGEDGKDPAVSVRNVEGSKGGDNNLALGDLGGGYEDFEGLSDGSASISNRADGAENRQNPLLNPRNQGEMLLAYADSRSIFHNPLASLGARVHRNGEAMKEYEQILNDAEREMKENPNDSVLYKIGAPSKSQDNLARPVAFQAAEPYVEGLKALRWSGLLLPGFATLQKLSADLTCAFHSC